MNKLRSLLCVCTFLLSLALLPAGATRAVTAELKPETLAAFDQYVAATEARINKELSNPQTFLHIDRLPEGWRANARALMKGGSVFMLHLETNDARGRKLEAPDGLIHHWMGAVFVPEATLPQALALVQDYDRHQDIYRPEVVRSRLIWRRGNDFKIYYRLRKHKVITVTLNTEHDVRYTPVDSTHCYSRSVASRIAEVENADQPNERERLPGQDDGYLWRLISYWRFVEREGGLYIECESISLTRDIPAGLAWLIKPFITGIPKESLQASVGATRSALLALRAQPGS